MITVLGLYCKKTDQKPTLDNVNQALDTFETEDWEYNCYSRDIVIVSEHDFDADTEGPVATKANLYANWYPKTHYTKIAHGIQTHHYNQLDHGFFELMGLNVYQEERGIHESRIRNLYGDLQCLTDTIGQIAALPHGVENNSPIVYNKGMHLTLQHDPWRYFKILKTNQMNRRSAGIKSTGGNGQREPINSSNIIFCESIDSLHEMCVGHYHCLYTLTRPIIILNILKFQAQASHTTLNKMNINNFYRLLVEHLDIEVVTFDQFEQFEEQFWMENDDKANVVEYL